MIKKLSVLSVVVGGIVLLGVAAFLIAGLVSVLSPAVSVGIIGGADGPTAIAVSGPTSTAGIFATIAIGLHFISLGMWGLRKSKK